MCEAFPLLCRELCQSNVKCIIKKAKDVFECSSVSYKSERSEVFLVLFRKMMNMCG